MIVAVGLIALIAANDDDGEGATRPPSSTTTVTASPEATAFQTQVDDAFKPLGDAIKVFLPRAQEFEAGKVTPADFKANVDLALPEFFKARDAVAKIAPYQPDPAVNRYFVDAAQLYVEVARIYDVAVDPVSEPLRGQLTQAARRLRTLGDRIYDRGRVVLDPTFYAPPSADVELRPPTEVPDWVAEGMAAGPPLADPPGPAAEVPPIREATCAEDVAPPCRKEESKKKWEGRVKDADLPQPAEVARALDEENAVRLGELAAAYESGTRTLRAAPDPKGNRERAAVVALALLTDGEAARLGQVASMLPPGEARNRLLAVARRTLVVGDGLLDPGLGLRPSGLPESLLQESGP
ncbi:MAG TPA: hypothetical protein VFS16_18410 [Acidimicrobiia bacterium]|nr:hypothetical protein [Acidimicrobiia bacterium]